MSKPSGYFSTITGEEYTNGELENAYADFLDEIYGTVSVAGLEYDTSRALALLDPIAFRVGFADWISAELEDGASLTEDRLEDEDED